MQAIYENSKSEEKSPRHKGFTEKGVWFHKRYLSAKAKGGWKNSRRPYDEDSEITDGIS